MLHFRGDISPRESRKTTSHRSSTRYYFNCNSNFLLDIVVEQLKNQLWSVLMRNVAFFYCRNQPPSNFKVHKVTALSVSLCLCSRVLTEQQMRSWILQSAGSPPSPPLLIALQDACFFSYGREGKGLLVVWLRPRTAQSSSRPHNFLQT